MQSLNETQIAAVHSNAADTCIIAGPGSGKTTVLIARIVYLIEQRDIDPSAIAVMTFTNAGAVELKRRLKKSGHTIGFVGTLHAFCFRLLQRYGSAIGYREGAITLVTEDEAIAMKTEVAHRLRLKITQKELHKPTTPDAQLVHRDYLSTLRRGNMVDYDRVLEEAERIAHLSAELEHLIGDEQQDSAEIDFRIMFKIPADCITLVGDTDQSIYGFRGAMPACLLDFYHKATTARFVLEINYRSSEKICEAANRLIRNNKARVDKRTLSGGVNRLAPGSGVCVYDCPSRDLEIQKVTGLVAESLKYTRPEEVAILTRNNADRELYSNAIRAMGLAQPAPEAMPSDWVKALLILNMCADPTNGRHALAWISSTKGAAAAAKAEITARAIGSELGAPVMFHGMADVSKATNALASAGISGRTIDLIAERVEKLTMEDPTLTDLIHDLWQHSKWSTTEEDKRGVEVLTIHASKGREWDSVIIAGCEDGTLPSHRVGVDIEEERRLMFVAITRARVALDITFAREVFAWGKRTPKEPSQFIKEINYAQR